MKRFAKLAVSGSTTSRILSFAVVGLTVGAIACGSEKKSKTTGTVASTNPNAISTGGGNTPTTVTTVGCESSKTSTYQAAATPSTLSFTAKAGGTAAALPTVLFISDSTNADTTKAFKVAAFDFDYCDFSYEYGFGRGPLVANNAATFFLINDTPGKALEAGDYTVGATTGKRVVTETSLVEAAATNTAGAKCKRDYYAPTAGTVTLTTVPTPAAGYRFTGGLVGTFKNFALANGATLTGDFTSGTCSAGPNPAVDTTKRDACSCGL